MTELCILAVLNKIATCKMQFANTCSFLLNIQFKCEWIYYEIYEFMNLFIYFITWLCLISITDAKFT